MSIDYSHLHRVVTEMEQGTAATTRYSWLDLAKELTRLQAGMEQLRETCLSERDAAFNATPMRGVEVQAFNLCAERLSDLLDGDAHDRPQYPDRGACLTTRRPHYSLKQGAGSHGLRPKACTPWAESQTQHPQTRNLQMLQ